MTYLKDKMRTAAAAYAPLTALIGTNPMRWWNVQLRPGAAFPAVSVSIVSNPPTYAFAGPLKASFARVQIIAWDTNPERLEDLDQALQDFVHQYNGAGLANPPVQPNNILSDVDGMVPQTQPPQYTRTLQVKIFDNPNVS